MFMCWRVIIREESCLFVFLSVSMSVCVCEFLRYYVTFLCVCMLNVVCF